MTFLLFITGCLLLFFGGHFLVESSSQIARRLHVSELIIGLTLVSIGTSLPEVVVNIIASLQAESDVVIGNILGSNISNTLLILGATGVLSPLIIPTCRLARELRFYCFCIAVLALSIFASQPYQLSSLNGILLIICFFFAIYLFFIPKNQTKTTQTQQAASLLKSIPLFIIGCSMLPLGGHLLIDSALILAQSLGLSISFISLFAVALGTSLPELVTSLIAAYRGNTELALGNIIGSNIFNITLVLGISALINPILFHTQYISDIIVMSLAIIPVAIVLFFFNQSYFSKSLSSLMFFSYLVYSYIIWIR
ncbi:hypothetical protein CL657_03230 [bacterium]|nr:hypothetical protein [bacterium]